ncbi:MAG: type II secretion system F family protein [Patescibacteria group bacterium]|mgnify:FL=1
MAKFSYRARNRDGREVSGYQDANDRYELARTLRNNGMLLLSADDVDVVQGGGMRKAFSFNINLAILRRIKLTEKILFSKNLGVMIAAGLALTRALDALGRETHNPKFKVVIDDLVAQIKQGHPFATSLATHPRVFSQLYISMVEAGEKSGKLQESLGVLASQMEADHDIIRKVRGAMMYPMIIFIAMIGIGVLMLIYVVPTLTQVFTELKVDLPASTQFIIGASNLFLNYSLFMFAGGAIIIAGIVQLVRTPFGKRMLDIAFVRAPLVGPIAKKFNAARTARTLSSLISAGVQILEALEVTSRVVQNHLYSAVLMEAKVEVQRGETMSKIFLKYPNLYPSLMGEMLAVGEETGQTSKMLEEVAVFYEQQVSDATRDLSTVIEPILMIVIGAVVGFFAVSMISPMYSLTGAI